MPEGKAANALEKLLVEKYGIPPEEAYDYAAEIIADQRGQGKLTGDRGKYLQQEALGDVAEQAIRTTSDLENYAKYLMEPPRDRAMWSPRSQQQFLDWDTNSLAQTHQEAARVYQEREAARQQAPTQAPLVQRQPNYGPKEASPQVQAPSQGLMQQLQDQEAQNPHERRLQRAMALRNAVLGE